MKPLSRARTGFRSAFAIAVLTTRGLNAAVGLAQLQQSTVAVCDIRHPDAARPAATCPPPVGPVVRSDPQRANAVAPLSAARAVPDVPDWPIGAHLVTPRRGYTHHGIYVGSNRVVHYAGWSRALVSGPVEEVCMERFAAGREVSIKADARVLYSPEEAVARARSRLGEDRYRLASNNCEHFCEWCLSGESRSEQVDQIVGWARVVALAAERVFKEVFGGGAGVEAAQRI